MRWILALHVIGIVVWFAASLDLTRLLGHHAKIGLEAGRPLKSYQIKTYFYAGLPGFLLTLATGLTLLFQNAGLYLNPKGPWGPTFHLKLTLVLIAILIDQFALFKMRKLHADQPRRFHGSSRRPRHHPFSGHTHRTRQTTGLITSIIFSDSLRIDLLAIYRSLFWKLVRTPPKLESL